MQSKLSYILAGAGLLVGGALLFHYLTEKESVSSGASDAFMKDIEELGPLQLEKGVMKPEFFIALMKVVGKHMKSANADKKSKLLEQRRALYDQDKKDSEDYTKVVMQMMMLEGEA